MFVFFIFVFNTSRKLGNQEKKKKKEEKKIPENDAMASIFLVEIFINLYFFVNWKKTPGINKAQQKEKKLSRIGLYGVGVCVGV